MKIVRSFLNANIDLNADLLCFVVLSFIALFLVAFIIATFVYEEEKGKAVKKQIADLGSSIRLFYISKPDNSVRFFNLSDMGEVKVSTLESFYSSFPISEQSRVREWIDDLLEGKEDTPRYLEVDVYFHKERRTAPSFLKVDSVNKARGILHLQSRILNYSRPIHSPFRTFNTFDDYSQALSLDEKKAGMSFCFTLIKTPTGLVGFDPLIKDGELSKELFERFRKALFPYASNNDILIRLSGSEIALTNFDMIDESAAIYYALKVKNGIDKALGAAKKKERAKVEVRVGIASNRDFLADANALLEAARKAAGEAIEKNISLAFYSKEKERKQMSPADELHYRSEVDRIIYEKKLSFSYRPIYGTKKKKIYGYIARCAPIGTSFSSIDELKSYAVRAKDEKTLFAAIAKKTIPTFVAERMDKNHKLFYPVKMDERELILSFFPHYGAGKEANLTFLFKEDDIAASLDPSAYPSFLKFVSRLRRNGYGFAIQMQGKALILDRVLLEAADAFFVDFSSRDDTNMDTSIRSELHALVEKLMRYKKPIVGINLMNWNAIELVVGSKVDFISSDVFAPYETMLKPISSKNIDRIKGMTNRK